MDMYISDKTANVNAWAWTFDSFCICTGNFQDLRAQMRQRLRLLCIIVFIFTYN